MDKDSSPPGTGDRPVDHATAHGAPSLRSCPFCGSDRVRTGHIRDGRSCGCGNCSASVFAYEPDADTKAREKWNMRGGRIEIRPGQDVRCIDAWDSFNNLKVGSVYTVLDTRDGFLFVRGESGHVGGWSASHFEVAP